MSDDDSLAQSPRIREWKHLDRIRNDLVPRHRDSAIGVLFFGRSGPAEQQAIDLARQQTAEPLIVRPTGRAIVPTLDQLRSVIEPDPQMALGEELTSRVVVILRLESFPARMFGI